MNPKSGGCARELVFNLRIGERFESAKRFAGGWIYGCDSDGLFSSPLLSSTPAS